MRQERYLGFSKQEAEKAWQGWKQGDSLSDIGRTIGKNPGTVHYLIASNGGISPTVKKRAQNVLTLADREEISRGLASSLTIREIALQIGKVPSTVCREINRNGGRKNYRAHVANNNAWERARRPKQCYLAKNHDLRSIIIEKLTLNWSPEQISGWLKQMYPNDHNMNISHETIYKSLFIQTRGILNKSLTKHLRTKRMMRRPKNAKIDRHPRGQIIDAISIKERPAEAEDRAIPGHWEGDLITGSKNTHIATLVERCSRFTMLIKVKGKDTISVIDALKRKINTLPKMLRISLTWDRGMELANHKQLSLATNMNIYFCDPRSPWQRGTNENTNGLLRQYFPKKTVLSMYTQDYLDKIALQLNQRPRKSLRFYSPADKLQEIVATTA
jgi:IS30 family transposase